MKKILVIFAVLAMVSGLTIGCETLYQKVCNPTVDEKATIDSYKAQATILLAFLKTQVETPEVLATIAGVETALLVYEQVLAGVCLVGDVVQSANATVVANKTLARAKMKYRY